MKRGGKMGNKNKQQQRGNSKAVVSPAVRDYGNDPYFIKKANDSKQFLEKHGFPKAFPKHPSGA